MRSPIVILMILLLETLLISCETIPDNVNRALDAAGKNRKEIEKVITHYKQSKESQKLKAAYFLIGNMADQFSYTGKHVDLYRERFNKMDSIVSSKGEKNVDYVQLWDSLQPTHSGRMYRVFDIKTIQSEYLIDNIDRAFVAWSYPWVRAMSFDTFCQYILPYKLKDETPSNWREYFQGRYRWIVDSLKETSDARVVAEIINDDLRRWFYITKLNCSFDLSFDDIIKLRSGRCAESTQMTAYAMRAMGIPVVLDFVPIWANRNSGHDWNGLVTDKKVIPFLGSEIDPGVYKIEFAMPGSIKSKRAKVFRRSFLENTNCLASQVDDLSKIPGMFHNKRLFDVTSEYVPVSDVQIEVDTSIIRNLRTGYLCVFNGNKWQPVYWGNVEDDKIVFREMATGVIYLPAAYVEGEIYPLAPVFILKDDGLIQFIKPNQSKLGEVHLDRKFPYGDKNVIQPGEEYELFYWDDDWITLGKQTATENSLIYKNVSESALLWLKTRDNAGGRIFTIQDDVQTWW